jgi:hypothetical protein
MTDIFPVLGVLAGAVGVADTIPYVRDILRGSTRPHRGTWLIWGVLAIVVCLSQRADGASWSLIMAGTQAVMTSLIFMLAIRHGEGGVTSIEIIMIVVAGAGVTGWILADQPIIAIACVVAADLIGAAMMVPKTRRAPESETLVTFALASLGGALAAGAVGTIDVSLLLYPAYSASSTARSCCSSISGDASFTRPPSRPCPPRGRAHTGWSSMCSACVVGVWSVFASLSPSAGDVHSGSSTRPASTALIATDLRPCAHVRSRVCRFPRRSAQHRVRPTPRVQDPGSARSGSRSSPPGGPGGSLPCGAWWCSCHWA